MQLIEALHYGFIQRALVAGIFVSILCAVLGLFLVLRRFSLIGDGLAHVTFGSVALGLFWGIYPLYASIPLVCISSLGILRLTQRARIHADAAIGIVSSLGISIGIVVASIAGGFNIDLFSYLFGNILAISRTEVVLSVALSLGLIMAVAVFYYDLFSVTFDENYARVSGIKTGAVNRVLVVLTSLTVVLAMKVVGIMLVSSLLILPAVTALQLGRGFKATLFIAGLAAVCAVVLGIFVSFAFNLPTGAVIVLMSFFCLLLAFVAGRLLRIRGAA
ncbi:MAG TPA: metal ABC transporter permease [Patescibacteria group bacterium]|nr:metal ABC transporter permease [Patescibacteria group bacterium]